MRARIAAVAAIAFILPVEAQTVRIHWSDLAAAVTGEKVALAPPQGPRVEGRVIAVEPDALRLQTKAPGETRLPRASITTLELRQMRKSGRIAGVIVGGAVGFGAALAIEVGGCILSTPNILLGAKSPCNSHAAAALAVGVGLPVAGYFVGKWADRKNTRIYILPDAP